MNPATGGKKMSRRERIVLKKSVTFAEEMARICLLNPCQKLQDGLRVASQQPMVAGCYRRWLHSTREVFPIKEVEESGGAVQQRRVYFDMIILEGLVIEAECLVFNYQGKWTSGEVTICWNMEIGIYDPANTQRFFVQIDKDGDWAILT